MKKEEVIKLATPENPVIAIVGNKIQFATGDIYVLNIRTGLYYKAKCFVL